MHFNQNGTINDKPTLAIIMELCNIGVYGQISLATLNDCFNQVGYEIKELKPQ